MENVKTREARMVQPGEAVFGYAIKTLDRATSQLILEKDGREFRLKLGNNKPASPASRKSSDENERDPRRQPESREASDRSNSGGEAEISGESSPDNPRMQGAVSAEMRGG